MGPVVVRLFVAVNLPEQLRRDLDTRLDTLRDRVRIAWTRPETWHLTLMFLGEWPETRLQPLREALQEAVAPHPWFLIRPGAIGAFSDLRRPRVLFLHLDGGDPLRALARDVRAAVDAVWPDGPQDHKALRPHLTLARIKRPLQGDEGAQLRAFDVGTCAPFPVSAVHLMASELRAGGARHTCRATLVLGG